MSNQTGSFLWEQSKEVAALKAENEKLKAEIKRKDETLEEAINSICRLCIERYPWHGDCTSCSEIEIYRQALSEVKE